MADIIPVSKFPRWRDPFEVPPSLIPEGMSYQWCAKRADSTGERDENYKKMLDGGWVLVPRQWVPGGTNMISGNDLMCRPKFLTEAAQVENVRKAEKLVEDWAERYRGQFSGGVRVWTGDAQKPPAFKSIDDPALSAKVISPQQESPSIFEQAAQTLGPLADLAQTIAGEKPSTRKQRAPRKPWLAWLFNLISVEQ